MECHSGCCSVVAVHLKNWEKCHINKSMKRQSIWKHILLHLFTFVHILLYIYFFLFAFLFRRTKKIAANLLFSTWKSNGDVKLLYSTKWNGLVVRCVCFSNFINVLFTTHTFGFGTWKLESNFIGPNYIAT